MKKSLALKMLFLTFGSFFVLISGIVLSLFIYFNYFYEPQKIDHVISAINDFSETYKTKSWTDEQLYSEVSKFMKNQNATMSILGSGGTGIDVILGTSPTNATPALSGKMAGSIAIAGGKEFSQDNIVIQGSTSPNKFEMATSTKINGTYIYFPVGVRAAVSVSSRLEQRERAGVQYILSDIPYTNYKQVDFIKKTILQSGEVKTTFVNVSLQSIDEVMDVLNHFYPYLIAFALLLSLLMAHVYSKTISKPIVEITGIANRMANMELGITSNLVREDELGHLSSSLNTLSSNLKKALDEVVVANEQLKLDYEGEIKQEKARKEFVANVSHELKTPLGVIKSFSEGIRDGVKEEKRDYYVGVILDEINKMDRLIVEMLEISKFDAGAVAYNNKEINLKYLVNRVVGLFGNSLIERQLSIEIKGDFGTASIDEEKITRVLSNLIGNAIKYCKDQSTIIIKGEQVEGQLKILIENECTPFSEEALEKIWDRFYKVDTSHNREKEGTGLGLAITKSILEGHSCTYGVENTTKGVAFYFNLKYLS